MLNCCLLSWNLRNRRQVLVRRFRACIRNRAGTKLAMLCIALPAHLLQSTRPSLVSAESAAEDRSCSRGPMESRYSLLSRAETESRSVSSNTSLSATAWWPFAADRESCIQAWKEPGPCSALAQRFQHGQAAARRVGALVVDHFAQGHRPDCSTNTAMLGPQAPQEGDKYS